MSRLTQAILQPGAAYGAGRQAVSLDPQFGGMHGYSPDLTEWVSNQQYIRRPLVCTLIEAPKAFQLLPNPDQWVGTLRALFELHALRIDGLMQTLEVEFAETPVGGGGQMQEDISDVKEGRSQPVFTWNEKYGMPVHNFLAGWIRMCMMDPNSKYPGLVANTNRPTDFLADMTSATALFYEPDPTHTKVMKAWLVGNMMPKSAGDVQGRRDLTAAQEASSYDISFTAIAQQSDGVMLFAQRLLDGLSMNGANPYSRPAFIQEVEANVAAARKSYSSNVTELGAQAVRS